MPAPPATVPPPPPSRLARPVSGAGPARLDAAVSRSRPTSLLGLGPGAAEVVREAGDQVLAVDLAAGRADARAARCLAGPELIGDPLVHDHTALVMPFLHQPQQVRDLGDGAGAEHLERAHDGAVVVAGIAVSLERADGAPVAGIFVGAERVGVLVDQRGAPTAAPERAGGAIVHLANRVSLC